MCGLVGVVGSITAKERRLFSELLLADVVRGAHSTGVMAMTKDGIDVYKKAMPSYDFLELPGTSKIILDATTALIGHNRHATLGAKISANAHPFHHGDIALVHNGTLDNKHKLPDGNKFNTDSEAVAYNLSLLADPVPFLETLEGAYALIWLDENNTVNLAKNDDRPLHWFQVQRSAKSAPSLVFSSERALGAWGIERAELMIVQEGAVPCGQVISIDLDTLVTTKVPFTVKKKTWPAVTTRKFTYPQNTTVDFVVTSITKYGIIGDAIKSGGGIYYNTNEYEVEAYSSGQSVQFEVGKTYRGKVLNIENGSVMRLSPFSVTELVGGTADNKKKQSEDPCCAWCDMPITRSDFAAGRFSYMGKDCLHEGCYAAFIKDTDGVITH